MKEAILINAGNHINAPLVARLKAHMNKKGLNPKTLAERAKVGRSFVYDIINGKSTNPTSSKLAAIAEQLGVSVNYLVSGVRQVVNLQQRDDSNIIEITHFAAESAARGQEVPKRPYYFNADWITRKLRAIPSDLRVVTISGDCMATTLQDGDTVIVNITKKLPNPPGLFVIFDGVGTVAKRLDAVSPGRVRIISDNPRYSPYERELSELNIIGKVVWLAREV